MPNNTYTLFLSHVHSHQLSQPQAMCPSQKKKREVVWPQPLHWKYKDKKVVWAGSCRCCWCHEVALALRCCLFSIASWSLCLPYPLGPPQMTPIKLGWMRPVCQGILYLHLSPCSFYTHIVSQSYLMPALGIQSILQVFITPCSKQNLLTLGIHVISKAFWKIKIGSYCCGVGCSALGCRLYAENHSLTIAKLVQLARAFSVLITGCAAGTQLKLEWIEVCPSYGNTCGLWPHAILILRCSRCPLMARAPLILCSCCVFGIALIAKFLHE